MSYRILSSNVIIGSANVPDYALVAAPDGTMQIERLDGNAAILNVDGNLEADHLLLTTLTTPNKVLSTDPAGRVITTAFDVAGLGNATALTTGVLPTERLKGSYTLDTIDASGTVTAGSFIANIDAADLTSGYIPSARLANGVYTFDTLTLTGNLDAAALNANLSANNVTSGTLHPDRLSGAYDFASLSLTGNLDAAWVNANLDATNLTGVLSDDRLVGAYTFDTLTISNVATANAVRVSSLAGSNVLVSDANAYIVTSNITTDEMSYVSGVVGPIQTQINELANGNIIGSNITNLNADNLTIGSVPAARLAGQYAFDTLTLSGNLVANSVSANLDASQLTRGTVPSQRLNAPSYTIANLVASGSVVAADVSANLDASRLDRGIVPPGRLAGAYTFDALTLSGNLDAASINANIDAGSLVAGTVDPTRLDFEGVTTNVTPASTGLSIGTTDQPWRDIYANTVTANTLHLGNAILYNGNAVVIDLERTHQDIVPTDNVYTIGTSTAPWSQLYASNVIAAGNVTIAGSFVKDDGSPYLDLSRVETNVLPVTSNLSIGSASRPWHRFVASNIDTNTVHVNEYVTSHLRPSITSNLDLGSGTHAWGNVYAGNVHGNIDAADVFGNLDATVIFTGGSIDDLVIKVPAGTAAAPGLGFVDDASTGLYLAAPGNLGITCQSIPTLTVDTASMAVAGNLLPVSDATYDLGSAGTPWTDTYINNGMYAGNVSIVDDRLDGVDTLTCTNLSVGNVVASGTVSAATLEATLDASFLDGSIHPAQLDGGQYTLNDLTITGTANVAGSTVLRSSTHIIPQGNMVYDLGSADRVWRDLYLSGSTIHLGNATIHESGGNVVISKLNVSGSIIADGLTPDLIITGVQITNANWEPIDDTAISSSGGFFVLEGTGFAPGCLVKIAGTNVSATSYVDANHLRIQTGARTPGTYDISVIRGDTQTATLPSAIHISESVTWITSGNLGTVSENQSFSIPLQATSDSQVTYSANTLPPETSLNQTTGLLEGNITTVNTSTLYSFDIAAVDSQFQDSVRTFLLQLIVLLLYSTQYTDASWNVQTQTALDSNAANVYWTIDGVGMNGATGVLVDGTPVTSFTAVDDSTLRVTGPQKPRGTYDVTVQSAVGTKVLANAVFFSDAPTWETDAQLGNVNEGVGFSIPILANSDSNVSYSNVTPLPSSTTLNSSTGLIEGNVTGISNNTTIQFDVAATDAEIQSNTRTFTLTVLMVALGAFIGDSISLNISLVVTERGKLYSFGRGGYNGDGRGNRYIPTINNNGSLTGKTISQISCSPRHTTVLATDGSVHAWGYNLLNEGSLGDGSGKTQRRPVAVNGGSLSGKTVSFVACGGYPEGKSRGYAIATDGSVHAWGYNQGFLGDGTTTHRMLPVEITNNGSLNGKTLTKIVCGHYHTIAIDTDGYLHAWGAGSNYQLGNGSNTNQSLPILSASGSLAGKTVADVACGDYWTHVIATDGSLHAFGSNWYGNIGDGTTTSPVTVPKEINGGSLSGKTISHVSCGGRGSGTVYNSTVFALATDGTLHGWGYNAQYNLGNGGTANETSPVALTSGSLSGKTISMVSTSNSFTGGTIAIATDGSFHAWGNNYNGKYGNGGNTTSTIPVLVSTNGSMAGKVVSDIVLGEQHAVGLTTDGSLHVWGVDLWDTLGLHLGEDISANGSLNGKTISKAFGGYAHALAIATDGTLHAWGQNNTNGQIGDGTQSTTGRVLPVAVTGGSLSGKTVTDVRAGDNYSVALASDSTLHTWGRNQYGQLGDGSTTDRYSPVNITGTGSLSGKTVAAISCGYSHTVAIATDGTLHVWGSNSSYRLGDGTQTTRITPQYTGWTCTGVACGYNHTVLINNGNLYITGTSEAQGDGGGTNSYFSYMMNGSLSGKQISAVAAGYNFTLALATDSTLHSWGRNDDGQAGVGNTDYLISEPVEITANGSLNGKTIVKISCGYTNSMALASDGTVHAWGYNYYNTVGNDSGVNQTTLPTQVQFFGLH